MFNIYDGQGQLTETAQSHTEALSVIDWLVIHDHAHGPFRCALAALAA